MEAEEVLTAYVEDYLDVTAARSYADLESRQQGFHASLAFGAAGIAYAFWYAGVLFEDAELLAEAERWASAAAERVGDPLAFRVPLSKIAERPASHFLFGEAGVAFVRVLVAQARRDEATRRAALARFLELSRQSLAGTAELYNGVSGCLAGTAFLFRYVGDSRLRDMGDELARHLLAGTAAGEDGMVLQPGLVGNGLSHGRAGAHLALLLWSGAGGSPLPAWIAHSLEALLTAAVREPTTLCPDASYHSWLCNGFSGLAVLGARAHQHFARETLLTAAKGAALLALDSLTDQPDLCCGRAGVAFACLALARVDPEGPWRRHARNLALSTLLVEREEWAYAGLYSGEAGIPCLALSLAAGIDAGPPVFGGLEIVPPP